MGNITRIVRKTALKLEKHAPKILFVAGVVGFGATVVTAARAGAQTAPDIQELKDSVEEIEKQFPPNSAERSQIIRKVYSEQGVKIAKAYILPAALGVVSVVCLTKSHNLLTSRNVALTAAFGSLEKAYREYRQRVVDRYGLAADTQIAHDIQTREVVRYDDDGNPVVDNIAMPNKDANSIYSFMFDESNRCWSKDPGYNASFLENQQKWWNVELRSKGFVFLNDVLKNLGYEPTVEGQLVGWMYDGDGDGFIDFGFNRYPSFVAGYERSVRLDFNAEGIILDKI